MLRLLVAMALSLSLSACISTSVKSYTDSEFTGSKVARIVVDLGRLPASMRDEMEESIMAKLKASGIAATPIFSVIPPTRDVSSDEARELIAKAGFQAILTMQVTDQNERTTYVGSINNTYVTARAYGNQITGYGSGVSTPLVSARGVTVFRATLFDSGSGQKMWIGDLNTKAQGTAFVGRTDRIAESAAEGLVAKLREDGKI